MSGCEEYEGTQRGRTYIMSESMSIRGYLQKELSEPTVFELQERARRCRAASVVMTSVAGSGHPGGSLSSLDLYILLLGAANLTPENVNEIDRDRIVVSHGHTSPGVYSALADRGFMDILDVEAHFRQAGSPYQGHVERDVPGVDWGTGNLGQGLAAGVGFALAAKARGKDSHVYVVMGDGEQPKGQIAEARRIASKEKLGNLTVLIDWNDIQISGHLKDVMPVNIRALWEADGWRVLECDGHDYASLYKTIKDGVSDHLPTVLLCKTVMGKGVSFMEATPEYHGKAVSGDNIDRALKELGFDLALYEDALSRRKSPLPEAHPVSFPTISLDLGTPMTYAVGDKMDNRGAFGKALAQVGTLNYKKKEKTPLLAFDCDLAGSVKLDGFAKECPESFIQLGIQEHAAATIVGAASTAGVVPVWADFGVFGVDEVYNQQRLNDVNRAASKTVLTHVGLDVGEDGMTHQCIDYAGLLRNTFHWKLVVPADPNQTDRATRWMLTEPTNVCLAMGRSVLPIITREDGTPFFAGDYVFHYGKLDLLRKGCHGTFLAMGHMVNAALEAREILLKEGIDIQVLHCAAPLALDTKTLIAYVGNNPLVTCEDHHADTGLGSIVAVEFARAGHSVPLKTMGVTRYGDSGASKDVFARMGLTAVDIAREMKKLLNK